MPRGLNHHGVIALDGKLYVFGGADEAGRPTTTSLSYDPTANEWRTLSPEPTPRASPGVAAYDGKIYVLGGIGARNTPVLEIYDPASDSWSTGPAMAVARDHFVLEEVGGKLIAAGGRIGNAARNLDTVEILDPVVGAWSFGNPLPEARSGIAGAVVDGKVYVFGGEDPGQTHDSVFVYDVAGDAWSTGTPMPTPRHGLAAVAAMGQIHVLGGGLSPGGGSDTAIHEVLVP
jgi:N-acetylneuraminic acid mutarotase